MVSSFAFIIDMSLDTVVCFRSPSQFYSSSFISQIFLLPIPAFTAVIPAEDSTRSRVICFATVLFPSADLEQFTGNTKTDRTTHTHRQFSCGVRMFMDNHAYRTHILRRISDAVHLGEWFPTFRKIPCFPLQGKAVQ